MERFGKILKKALVLIGIVTLVYVFFLFDSQSEPNKSQRMKIAPTIDVKEVMPDVKKEFSVDDLKKISDFRDAVVYIMQARGKSWHFSGETEENVYNKVSEDRFAQGTFCSNTGIAIDEPSQHIYFACDLIEGCKPGTKTIYLYDFSNKIITEVTKFDLYGKLFWGTGFPSLVTNGSDLIIGDLYYDYPRGTMTGLDERIVNQTDGFAYGPVSFLDEKLLKISPVGDSCYNHPFEERGEAYAYYDIGENLLLDTAFLELNDVQYSLEGSNEPNDSICGPALKNDMFLKAIGRVDYDPLHVEPIYTLDKNDPKVFVIQDKKENEIVFYEAVVQDSCKDDFILYSLKKLNLLSGEVSDVYHEEGTTYTFYGVPFVIQVKKSAGEPVSSIAVDHYEAGEKIDSFSISSYEEDYEFDNEAGVYRLLVKNQYIDFDVVNVYKLHFMSEAGEIIETKTLKFTWGNRVF